METVSFDAPAYDAENSAEMKVNIKKDVKQEAVDKDASFEEVKKEPSQEEPAAVVEEFTGRSTRKRKLNSMAETSDVSDESADENVSKPQAKRRSRGGAASAGRSRGRPRKSAGDLPTNEADPSRNPRIVLKNIATEDIKSTVTGSNIQANLRSTKSTRGKRESGGRTPAGRTPAKGGNKGKKKASKVVEEEEEEDEEEEEEEEIEEDGNGDVDFDEDVDDDDDDDDEDFIPKKGKKKQTPRTRGKGKGKSKTKHEPENDEEEDEEDEDGASADGAETNPNAVKTGQYLIEKSDMRRLENYPIWRMEGPNMLRKFEMIVQDAVVRHKSLYAYSSWAQSMLDLYEKIQVTQTSSQDGETIVQITSECLPKSPDLLSLEEKYGRDELVHVYFLYIEALFRQSVDSGFLKRIKMENDSPYVNAINHIDTLIKEKITNIENEISMKEEFKTRVRNCPNMKSIRRQNWSQTDQATVDKFSEKGVRSVLMFGYGYDPFLMEEDKSKGVEVAQEVVIGSTMENYLAAYHGLIHFKYSLLRRCQDKVKLTNALETGGDSNVLDRCLQDRAWILQTFEDLKNLLANENLS